MRDAAPGRKATNIVFEWPSHRPEAGFALYKPRWTRRHHNLLEHSTVRFKKKVPSPQTPLSLLCSLPHRCWSRASCIGDVITAGRGVEGATVTFDPAVMYLSTQVAMAASWPWQICSKHILSGSFETVLKKNTAGSLLSLLRVTAFRIILLCRKAHDRGSRGTRR